ncbi:MAG: 2-C-methyl-D-erythritol 4-phosphate cytidylyltransferase [Clostridia bacterium]|nr:2-C-methyl-D-erythritol 4-phosphate cytidylyltransferase [Clostridia bacterium]
MIYAAIVAGGTGSRMGADIPKQFLTVSGKPVLIHTILCFSGLVDRVVVACHADYVGHTVALAEKHGIDIDVIQGGADRMGSLGAILNHLEKIGATEKDILLTHDGVRPFVSREMIENSIENAVEGHFSTVAVNATDTVCIESDGEVVSVPERKNVFNIQTPQTFTFGKLKSMLEGCENPGRFTDLCGLALHMGEQVKIVEGNAENIKITVPADLAVAEAILEKRNENR